jgi:hypothetical protein
VCTQQLAAPVLNPDPPNRFVQAAILNGQPLLHPDTVAIVVDTGIVMGPSWSSSPQSAQQHGGDPRARSNMIRIQ